MKFRMNCPKCGSTNFSIERDNRSYAPRGQTFEMIFSCRCGKQMFGDQIVKEYERQKKDWEALQEGGASNRPPYDDARPTAAGGRSGSSSRDDDDDDDDLDDLDIGDDDDDDDDVASSAPPSRSDSRSEARAEPRPEPTPEPSRRRAEEDTAATAAAPHDHAHDHAHEDGEDGGSGDSDHCGWNGCTNPPRPNSKYCSRDCSNKNARLRYKQRKGTEQEAA